MLFMLFTFLASVEVNALVLKQVVILSRHNIRAPLTKNLEEITQLKWPEWTTETAFLTPKGAVLEGYMGEYFFKWLADEKLFDEPCPQSVHFYANAPQRTRATAEAFVNTAFKNCNISVKYKENVKSDPVFHPVLLNTTASFKEMVISNMQRKLNALNLSDAYELIHKIIDIKTSKMCEINSFCDLTKIKDEILFEIDEEPNIHGPLSLGNTIVDVFLMSLYEGNKLEDIAWGKITSPEQWKTLLKITKENQNVRFNSTSFSKHLAKPLLEYMKNLFLNDSAPKFTGLFGHDSNLNTVMTALGFKHYELPNQFELTPVGGKLVFQKWQDEETSRNFLKINYIYPSVDQIRFGTKLSANNPPQSVIMEIDKCKIDEKGFCPWDDFVTVLRNIN